MATPFEREFMTQLKEYAEAAGKKVSFHQQYPIRNKNGTAFALHLIHVGKAAVVVIDHGPDGYFLYEHNESDDAVIEELLQGTRAKERTRQLQEAELLSKA